MTMLCNHADPSSVNQLIRTNRRAQRVWLPEIPLNKDVAEELTTICHSTNTEICGFIDSADEISYIGNHHLHPSHNFLMSAADCEVAFKDIYQKKKRRIIGVFHTHPNNTPWPTPRDLVGWPNPALQWRYFIVTHTSVIEWELLNYDAPDPE